MYKITKHPLIQDKLTRMRKTETDSGSFRWLLKELTFLLGYEATSHLKLTDVSIDTPVSKNIKCKKLLNKITLIPILRAGLGMVDALKDLLPSAHIGHIGLYRDEQTLDIIEYYAKMPADIENTDVLLLDPMLATGKSAACAIDTIKKYNPKSITFIGIVGAPEGLEYMQRVHPDVDIYLGSLDDKLNEKGYIVPGLGDAGDRIFGTK